MSLSFSFKYFHRSFVLTLVTVKMSQQRQRTYATEVDSQHNAWDFPEELPGNSIDPLGPGYLLLISELSGGDSASALSSEDMLSALLIMKIGYVRQRVSCGPYPFCTASGVLYIHKTSLQEKPSSKSSVSIPSPSLSFQTTPSNFQNISSLNPCCFVYLQSFPRFSLPEHS